MKKKSISSCLLPHRSNNRFYNHAHDKPESLFFHTIPSFLSSLKSRSERLPLDPKECVLAPQISPRSQMPVITWLGHATFLIQIGNVNILTDPILGQLSWFFPRMLPIVLPTEQLPEIDMVLLSHNHPDHTDIASLKALPKNASRWIGVPQGDKQWMEKYSVGQVEEFNWWEQVAVATEQGTVTVTFLPAHHWSARGFFDRNRSLWGSWMIQSGDHTIYFGGDSAYWDHYQVIGKEFNSISLALLPIGPCEPEEWMRRTHMNPEQAIKASVDLNARRFLPMHWGAFPFGKDHFEGPVNRLKSAWETNKPSDMILDLIKTGQTVSL